LAVSAVDYLRLLRQQWRTAVACVGVIVLLALVSTVTTPRRYRADAQVFVTTAAKADTANQLALAETYVQARVQSYPTIATSPLVTKPVIEKLGLSITPADLGSRITATAAVGTVVVTLSVTDKDPAEAARLTDAVAEQFARAVEEVERTPASETSRVRVTVTRTAQVPSAPVSPKPLVNLALALVLGLLVGVAAAILRGVLDRRIRTADVLEGIAGVSVLAVIPRDRGTPEHPLVIESGSQGRRAEAYRQLRTNLRYVAVDRPPRVIAITSAMPGEGKTTTALNLAAALAEAGHRVCLVESDLRRPTLAGSLGLVGEVGLTTALIGSAPVSEAAQELRTNLAVLTSGALPPNPSEVLRSEQVRSLIESIAAVADYTIIDTAPLLPVTDGVEVASLADATLLVVRAGRTTHHQVTAAKAALATVGVHAVGVVLNGATSTD
jgi:capsular exopolysaccharide synthesis family protein